LLCLDGIKPRCRGNIEHPVAKNGRAINWFTHVDGPGLLFLPPMRQDPNLAVTGAEVNLAVKATGRTEYGRSQIVLPILLSRSRIQAVKRPFQIDRIDKAVLNNTATLCPAEIPVAVMQPLAVFGNRSAEAPNDTGIRIDPSLARSILQFEADIAFLG